MLLLFCYLVSTSACRDMDYLENLIPISNVLKRLPHRSDVFNSTSSSFTKMARDVHFGLSIKEI